jgi:hypothetical protein
MAPWLRNWKGKWPLALGEWRFRGAGSFEWSPPTRRPLISPLHHSDKWYQATHVAGLHQLGPRAWHCPSYESTGDCYDNAAMDLLATLKRELSWIHDP